MPRIIYLRLLIVLVTIVCAEGRPNVLFIAVDDLRPALGCYGDKTAVTPNLDKLAGEGILFERAYCQLAVCSPSRLSLMTGHRPDSIRVWDLVTHFRKAISEAVTLPQFFKQNGYHTRSIGKILHGSGSPSKDPVSWSVDPIHDVNRDPKSRYASKKNLKSKGLKRSASESAEVPDETYMDGLICQEAEKALRQYGENSPPFFLAVGFKKPHLPFCAPKKYWDLYDRKKISLPSNPGHPEGAPELATRSWRELEGYTDIPQDGKLSEKKIRELRHGYYACVSYVDVLVGRLLKQLEASGLAENTVVCLWGDHGFHLGEQGLWTKANNYELSARVPLLFRFPEKIKAGKRSAALVELVDVYPTLVRLCGLKAPSGLEGISLMPLIEKPGLTWKSAAFTQYPRSLKSHRHRGPGDVMGYAVRTDTHRYVEWREGMEGKVLHRELYDHREDPEEMKNVAALKKNTQAVARLAEVLSKGWRGALPSNPSKP